MIIESNKNMLQTESFGDFESLNVGIKETDMGFLYDILSNKLYSDPHSSVVREITSNCLDAHIGAKKPENPIIISLYQKDDVHFISFKDEGTGMSDEVFRGVYLSYLDSTKRADNSQLGGFGLGSKTPFSVSNFYYVTTRFEGVQKTYLMSRENQKPEPILISNEETLEQNGTVIDVPIKKDEISSWVTALHNQLRYFDTVFIVDNLHNHYNKIDNDYKIIVHDKFKVRFNKDGEVLGKQMHIVIDKVYYPLDFEKLGFDSQINIPIGVLFNIGEIQVTPNRELVDYSFDSIKIIKKRIEEALIELNQVYEQKSRRIDNLFSFDALLANNSNGTTRICFADDEIRKMDYSNFSLLVSDTEKKLVKKIFGFKDFIKNHFYGPAVDNFKHLLAEEHLSSLSENRFYTYLFNYKTCLSSGSKDKTLYQINKDETNIVKILHRYNGKKIIVNDTGKDDLRKNQFISNGIMFGIDNVKKFYISLSSHRKNQFNALRKNTQIDYSVTSLTKVVYLYRKFIINEIKKCGVEFYSDIIVPDDFGRFKKEREKDIFNCTLFTKYDKTNISYTSEQLLDKKCEIIIYCSKDDDSSIFNHMNRIYQLFNEHSFIKKGKHFLYNFKILALNKGTVKFIQNQNVIKNVYSFEEIINGKFELFNSIFSSNIKSDILQHVSNEFEDSRNYYDVRFLERIYYFLNFELTNKFYSFIKKHKTLEDNKTSNALLNSEHFQHLSIQLKNRKRFIDFLNELESFKNEFKKLDILKMFNVNVAFGEKKYDELYEQVKYELKVKKFKKPMFTEFEEFIIHMNNYNSNIFYKHFIETVKKTNFKLSYVHYIKLSEFEKGLLETNKQY